MFFFSPSFTPNSPVKFWLLTETLVAPVTLDKFCEAACAVDKVLTACVPAATWVVPAAIPC